MQWKNQHLKWLLGLLYHSTGFYSQSMYARIVYSTIEMCAVKAGSNFSASLVCLFYFFSQHT